MLNRVIILRNVTFNKDTLFTPKQEKEAGQPLSIIRDIIKVIKLYKDKL